MVFEQGSRVMGSVNRCFTKITVSGEALSQGRWLGQGGAAVPGARYDVMGAAVDERKDGASCFPCTVLQTGAGRSQSMAGWDRKIDRGQFGI